MLNTYHKTFLSSPGISIWLGSANAHNVPDTVRATGLTLEENDIICCYVSQNDASQLLQNISENKRISLVASEISNFVTYQYKATVIATYTSNREEEIIQEKFMDNFCTTLTNIFPLPKEKIYNMYLRLPSVSIKFKVEKIFEQSPKKDTGGEVFA